MTRPADRSDAAAPPNVQVVRGEPDDAELAALVAGLAAAASADGGDPAPAASAWLDRGHAMRARHLVAPGRGDAAWRHSLR